MSRVVRLDRPRPLREAATTAAAIARLGDWRWNAPPWPGYPQPFAGQRCRAAALDALVEHFEPDAIIETGTFIGITTSRLAAWGRPVYSIEIKPQFLHLARARTRGYRAVTLIGGDSVAGLKWVRDHVAPRRPLAYLDAHWEARLPLHEELAVLLTAWSDAIVVVDDCRVPHDSGYGYDTYDGVAIEEERLELPRTVQVTYPTAPAQVEGGARRGTLYAGWGARARAALRAAYDRGLVTDVS